ncbi:MAG: hypothetical protein JKY48_17390 [Flavobacteriales bacterium]|nr:hypothetical protein [Flavobacteriales bacterium]
MKIGIQAGLFIVAIIIAYFIYDGIQDKIEFRDMAAARREVVQNRLLNITKAQKQFKQEKGRYSANFPELINFIKTDSLTIIKAIGNVPDTLTEAEAVEQRIVIRDTSLVPALTIFPAGFAIDSIKYIPFSKGNEFQMKADVIEKNKVNVNVFEASAKLEDVYNGLNTKNEAVNLSNLIKVGSLTEPITNGNW